MELNIKKHVRKNRLPVNGIDYIKNYFKILELANADELLNTNWDKDKLKEFKLIIKNNYKKQSMETHPDKVQTMHDTIKIKSENMFLQVKEAYDFLINITVEGLTEYCHKLKEFHPSLISEDGIPILPMNKNIDIDFLCNELEMEIPKTIQALIEMSNYDENLLEIVKDNYYSNGNEKNMEIYLNLLIKKLIFLQNKEMEKWYSTGVFYNTKEKEGLYFLPSDYVDEMYEKIQECESLIKKKVSNMIFMLENNLTAPVILTYEGSTEEIKKESCLTSKIEVADKMIDKSLSKFNYLIDEALKTVEEQEKTLLSIFELIKSRSSVFNTESNKKDLLIRVYDNDDKQIFCYKYELINDSLDVKGFDEVTSSDGFIEYAKENNINAYNCKYNKELNVGLFLFYIAIDHFNVKDIIDLKELKELFNN